MSIVAVCQAPGTAASTTTSFALASLAPLDQPTLFVEGDPSGGDFVSWAELTPSPSWASAIASSDQSWVGLRQHLRALPSHVNVIIAPADSHRAATVVEASAAQFGGALASLDAVVPFVDCGRTTGDNPWLKCASVVLVLLRQASTSGGTVSRIDRTAALCRSLTSDGCEVRVVLIGRRPFPPKEVGSALPCAIAGVLPDDPRGAAMVAGAWSFAGSAERSPLARAVSSLAAAIVGDLRNGSQETADRPLSGKFGGRIA